MHKDVYNHMRIQKPLISVLSHQKLKITIRISELIIRSQTLDQGDQDLRIRILLV